MQVFQCAPQRGESVAEAMLAAGRSFSAFWLTTKQQHTHASNATSHSMLDADSDGDVFMDVRPLLVEKERGVPAPH
jgi:hypothetical protein